MEKISADPYRAALDAYWPLRERVAAFAGHELVEALLAAHARVLEAQRLDSEKIKPAA
jgi:hypothetical protein